MKRQAFRLKKLELNKETLRELRPQQLAGVVGGDSGGSDQTSRTCSGNTCAENTCGDFCATIRATSATIATVLAH